MNNEAFLYGLVDEMSKQATSKNVKARMAESASQVSKSPRKRYAHLRTRMRELGKITGKMKRKPEEYIGPRAVPANIQAGRSEKRRSREMLSRVRPKTKLPG